MARMRWATRAQTPGMLSARLAFWSTGTSVFTLWNLATLIGVLGAQTLTDPRVLGLDAAAPAAFIALLAPRFATAPPGYRPPPRPYSRWP